MLAQREFRGAVRTNDKAYVGSYLKADAKRKLAAVAYLRGVSMSKLIEQLAERADTLAALLPAPSKSNGKPV